MWVPLPPPRSRLPLGDLCSSPTPTPSGLSQPCSCGCHRGPQGRVLTCRRGSPAVLPHLCRDPLLGLCSPVGNGEGRSGRLQVPRSGAWPTAGNPQAMLASRHVGRAGTAGPRCGRVVKPPPAAPASTWAAPVPAAALPIQPLLTVWKEQGKAAQVLGACCPCERPGGSSPLQPGPVHQ